MRVKDDDADLHAALAYAYDRMGRRSDALRQYDRAIAIDPSHPTAHAHRGAMLEASGRIEDARAAYRRADASAPSKARSAAQTKLAAAEFLAGNVEAARGLAQRAVESDAANAHARFVLGVAALRMGDRNTAAAQQQALAESDPERAEELGKLLAGGPG
jgi:tetratricopeptide (TPR) repeat protein